MSQKIQGNENQELAVETIESARPALAGCAMYYPQDIENKEPEEQITLLAFWLLAAVDSAMNYGVTPTMVLQALDQVREDILSDESNDLISDTARDEPERDAETTTVG